MTGQHQDSFLRQRVNVQGGSTPSRASADARPANAGVGTVFVAARLIVFVSEPPAVGAVLAVAVVIGGQAKWWVFSQRSTVCLTAGALRCRVSACPAPGKNTRLTSGLEV